MKVLKQKNTDETHADIYAEETKEPFEKAPSSLQIDEWFTNGTQKPKLISNINDNCHCFIFHLIYKNIIE